MAAPLEFEEDAQKLQLGPDFSSADQGAAMLWNGEVQIIIESVLEAADDDELVSDPAIMDTLKYVKEFNLFPNMESINDTRSTLAAQGYNDLLHDYEIASLVDLHIDSVEEAFSLIPSLKEKFGNSPAGAEKLQKLVNDIRRYQSQK